MNQTQTSQKAFNKETQRAKEDKTGGPNRWGGGQKSNKTLEHLKKKKSERRLVYFQKLLKINISIKNWFLVI